MRTALAIRHVAFEDLGLFGPVLEAAGYAVTYRDIGTAPLRAEDIVAPDLLIILGGPISIYNELRYPWLADELRLIERRLAAVLPIIGICLGAQLMARALGARVVPGDRKEIGFAPLTLTDAGRASCLAAFEGSPVLHWHGDVFDLPEGAVCLGSTSACRNQAFSYGRSAIGFQFHPDAGDPAFERWLIGHALELELEGVDLVRLRTDHRALAPELSTRAAACLGTWLRELDVAGVESIAPQHESGPRPRIG